MTLAILISAVILTSAAYILRSQRLATREFRGGRIRLVRGQAPAAENAGSNKR